MRCKSWHRHRSGEERESEMSEGGNKLDQSEAIGMKDGGIVVVDGYSHNSTYRGGEAGSTKAEHHTKGYRPKQTSWGWRLEYEEEDAIRMSTGVVGLPSEVFPSGSIPTPAEDDGPGPVRSVRSPVDISIVYGPKRSDYDSRGGKGSGLMMTGKHLDRSK